MGNVAGVQEQVGLPGIALILSMASLQCAGDILVCGLVEADVAVADLDEAEIRRVFRWPRRCRATSGEESRGGHAACHGPYQAGSGPGHAAEEFAAVDAVIPGVCFVAVGAGFKLFVTVIELWRVSFIR